MRSLRHLHATRWLSAYADGEMAGRRQAALERHMNECPDCTAVLAFIVAAKAVLGRTQPTGSHTVG